MRARVSAIQHKMEAKLKYTQEERKVAINSIPTELEDPMKNREGDVLACTDQLTRDLLHNIDTNMEKKNEAGFTNDPGYADPKPPH
jgi:hypothetical protein